MDRVLSLDVPLLHHPPSINLFLSCRCVLQTTDMLVTVLQSCKMFITSLWGTLYQLCGEDDYVIAVYGEVTGYGCD